MKLWRKREERRSKKAIKVRVVRVRGGEGKENVREWERKIKDVRIFLYSRAKEGEESCGDASLAEECGENSIIVAVIDALGHGKKAEEASEVAVNFIKSHKNLPLDKIVRGVHSALSGTRGAVASISKISDGRIEFVGVGNISAQIVRSGDECSGKFQQRLFSASGVLGWNLRHFKVFTYEFMSGWLVMNTDGVGHFIASEYLSENLREMAMKIMKEHGKVDDDATILILKR